MSRYQFLIGQDTARLIELTLKIAAKGGGLTPLSRMRVYSIADQFGLLSDQPAARMFPDEIGEPGDAGGVRDILHPVKWSDDFSGVACEWVFTVENEKGEASEIFKADSIHNLFKKTVGVMPVGFIEWAGVSLPGDKIMSHDRKTEKYFTLTVNPA